MGLVARFDFMPRVALNVFQQVPSVVSQMFFEKQPQIPFGFRSGQAFDSPRPS
jgi:hypothetical protein